MSHQGPPGAPPPPPAAPPPPAPGAPQFGVNFAQAFDDSAYDEQTRAILAEVRKEASALKRAFDEANKAFTKAEKENGKGNAVEEANAVNRARVAYDLYRSEHYQPYSKIQREKYIPLGVEISDIETRLIPNITKKLAESVGQIKDLKDNIETKRKRLLEHLAEFKIEAEKGINVRGAIDQIQQKIHTTASSAIIEELQMELNQLEKKAEAQISALQARKEALQAQQKAIEQEAAPLKAIYDAIPPLPRKTKPPSLKPVLPISSRWLAEGGILAKGFYAENLRDFALYKEETLPGSEHVLPVLPTRKSGGRYEEVTLGKAYQTLSTNDAFTLDTLTSIACGLIKRAPDSYCKTRIPERLDVFLKGAEKNEDATDLFVILKSQLVQDLEPKKSAQFDKKESEKEAVDAGATLADVEESLAAVYEQVEQANYLVQDVVDKGKGKEKEGTQIKPRQDQGGFSLRQLESRLQQKEQELKKAVAGDTVATRGPRPLIQFADDDEKAFQLATQNLTQNIGKIDKLIEKLKETEAFFGIESDETLPVAKRTAKTLEIAKDRVIKAEKEVEKEKGERAFAVAAARQLGREEAKTPKGIIEQKGLSPSSMEEAVRLYISVNGKAPEQKIFQGWAPSGQLSKTVKLAKEAISKIREEEKKSHAPPKSVPGRRGN